MSAYAILAPLLAPPHEPHLYSPMCGGLPYARRLVAHHYYHTMLNATHINMAMWTAMLCLVLAAARGLEASRGTPQAPCMA
eukprot:scaffold21976_cov56-Phaeocystis_antarctica.AAC.5